MADTIEQQIQDAQEQLKAYEGELASANAALSQWKQHDATREDGSMAQDRRHEESGDRRREAVEEAAKKVDDQKHLIAELIAQRDS